MEFLRTPDDRFVGLPDFDYEPRYVEVPAGDGTARMAYLDEGPADGEVVLCLHGEPSWSFLYRQMIAAWDAEPDQQQPLTADDIATALDHAGNLAALLAESERETRARLYQALDLELLLDPVGDSPTLDVRLQLCGGGGRI